MSIKVRYFAGLRERMGRSEESLAPEGLATVAEVWKAVSAGQALPETILCAVNMEYADPATPIHDGDEVAFFPPVTGG
ncbi:molybdopterin converting factor subunit 1 [Candidatus Methylocalor cossyra]|uniref:Molybdopterin synthase sulfur carrier subunit n=1 Tax=Candidatus Methylocalor cossyra TaxID=3108543 RepID=A0ABM9NKX6_9GAMM